MSTNGTWVNSKKLTKGEFIQVSLGDEIRLGSPVGCCFEIVDVSAPENMLLPVGSSYDEPCPSPIVLDDCNHLPSKENSEVNVFFVASNGSWYKQSIHHPDGGGTPLVDGDLVYFAKQNWQLKLVPLSESTLVLSDVNKYDDLEYVLCADRSYCSLNFRGVPFKEIFFGDADLNKFLIELALCKSQDFEKGNGDGLRDASDIYEKLGLGAEALSVLLEEAHRVIGGAIPESVCGVELVERKGAGIRFLGRNYRIYQSGELIASNLGSSSSTAKGIL
jgi:hypothetical protein